LDTDLSDYDICESKDMRILQFWETESGPRAKMFGKHCSRWTHLSKDVQNI